MDMIALMLVNYFHDVAVALLATNVMVVHFLGRHLDGHPVHDAIVPALFARLARVTWWTLGYVLAAGAVRAYFFMDFEWNPAVGRGQIAALVVKHVLLVGLTVFGIVLHARQQRKYGARP